MKKTKKNYIVITCTVLVNMIYIYWRVSYTIPVDASRISLFLAWGLFVAEILGIFELFVYLYGAAYAKIPVLPEINQELFPPVDVLIATYNEPAKLLRKTIIGCKNMKYPDKNLVGIYLCDDGNRKEMKHLAKELGIHYLSREDNKGAKAGNLNHALKHSKAPLIATFDADMIPMEDFLMETVPYFLEGKKIGFVQTPQSFYNPDLFQANLYSERHIPNEQDYFYRNVQITKNHTNTVIYGGSNTVISRVALEEVGGFFEKSITEDFATGILIQSKGYQCYATDKPLASGLAPNDFKSLVKQRERWARGCIQTIRRLNILFAKNLSWKQKISHASAIAYWYAPVKRFFYIISPIAFTVFGIQVIHATLEEIMLFFIPSYVFTVWSVRVLSGNIRNPRWTNIYETITFPSLMRGVLLESLGISQNKFSVTSKEKQASNDRRFHLRKSMPFYLYIFLSLVGIMNIFIYMPQYTTWNFLVLLFWLVVNMLYLIMALFFVLEYKKSNMEINYQVKTLFQLSDFDKCYKLYTSEISDTRIIFETDSSDIGMEEILTATFAVEFQEQILPCSFKVRVKKKEICGKSSKYQCDIVDINKEMTDVWNVFLHNRQPTMPQTMDNSKHIWNDLGRNIEVRLRRSIQ